MRGRVRIRSPSLKVLRKDGYFDELFVEDAPSLEWLLGDNLYQGGVHLRVAHAPRLEFLGYLGMGSLAVEIGETIFTVSSRSSTSAPPVVSSTWHLQFHGNQR
jgi:hypothetical protein